jgi:hypothetical protein
MGDCVGVLFYGMELKPSDGKKFRSIYGKNPETNKYETVAAEYVIEGDTIKMYDPYETEQYYLIIKPSKKGSYNGGTFIGENIVNPSESLINEFNAVLAKFGIEPKQIGWHLVGHYN